MKATLVPDQLTQCTALEAAHAIRSAWETLVGTTPSNETLACMMAQAALETGRFKLMHCWNFGNVKAGPNYEGSYCQFRCNEVLNGKVQWFDPPHPQTNFRAFGSLEVGALKWVQSLKEHFPRAWQALGMPLSFVHGLKLDRYFTADETSYAKAVASLWHEYLAILPMPDDNPKLTYKEPAKVDGEDELHAAALAAKANFDPLEAAREERNEQLREP